MRLAIQVDTALPSLSWCVACDATQDLASARVGPGVAVPGPEGFYEGAWAGVPDLQGLSDAVVCCASGAVAGADGLCVVAPSHTLGRLHTVRVGQRLWVSNSLAFVLHASGSRLLPEYPHYQQDLASVTRGLQKLRRHLPLADGRMLGLHYHCNLLLGADLTLKEVAKSEPPSFVSYEDYRRFLADAVSEILGFAARHGGYRPLTTISSGYDSTTCAVLAAQAGAVEAITVIDTEAADPEADSGAEAAAILGLKVRRLARDAYRDAAYEAEFMAVGTGGEDVYFGPLEDQLHRRVLITGFHGDKVWDRNNAKTGPDIVRGDPSGADLEEFRLRVNFIHLPLPFMGCQAHRSIHTISNLAEMAPWSVGGDYDRPICRRIAEDAGVPRDVFGRRKAVASRSTQDAKRLADWYFGAAGRQSFEQWLALHARPLGTLSDRLLHRLAAALDWAEAAAAPISHSLARRLARLAPALERYRAPLDHRRLLLHWALDQISDRYPDRS